MVKGSQGQTDSLEIKGGGIREGFLVGLIFKTDL